MQKQARQHAPKREKSPCEPLQYLTHRRPVGERACFVEVANTSLHFADPDYIGHHGGRLHFRLVPEHPDPTSELRRQHRWSLLHRYSEIQQ